MDGVVLLNEVKFWRINMSLGYNLIPGEREQDRKRERAITKKISIIQRPSVYTHSAV